MAYRVQYGPQDRRVTVGSLTTDMVMGVYEVNRAAGEERVVILDDEGNELDPHQLALDLRSRFGRDA